MKIYKGIQSHDGIGGQVITVEENGKVKILSPRRSQFIRNHSPDGFNWGYCGSGPAQTALGILLDVTNDEKISQYHYQAFKRQYVAGWGVIWEISEGEIETWLSKQNDGLISIMEGGMINGRMQ